MSSIKPITDEHQYDWDTLNVIVAQKCKEAHTHTDGRLRALEKEWSVERAVQALIAIMLLLSLLLFEVDSFVVVIPAMAAIAAIFLLVNVCFPRLLLPRIAKHTKLRRESEIGAERFQLESIQRQRSSLLWPPLEAEWDNLRRCTRKYRERGF